MSADERITFDIPPVKEVALGRTFLYRPDFLIPYFGAFWELIRDRYPQAEEASTIIDAAEPAMEANFSPRVFFVAADSRSLVQIQRNRFHYNWRQTEEPVPYVRFPKIKEECISVWSEFDAFVSRVTGRSIQPVRGELSYTNIIESDEGQSASELACAALVDASWASQSRFLTRAKAFGHTYGFDLPDGKSALQVQIVSARRAGAVNKEALKVELTVKGPCGPEDSFEDWALRANDFLVRAFKDLTTPDMHRKWKLRSGDGK